MMRRNSMEKPPKNFRIVLVGKTGSGKSSTGNTIMGPENSKKHFTVAFSPESVTKTCEKQEAPIDHWIIDTPGLFDTKMSEQEYKDNIDKCIDMSVPGPHAFLLVIRLGVRFTDEEKNTVKWIQKNFGEEAARYTIILFTHADALEKEPLEEYISKSNDLQAFVGECGGRFHSFNNKNIDNRGQVTELMKKIEKMVADNGGQHYTNKIYEEAQRRMRWEALQKTMKECGKTALVVAGTVATVGAVGPAVVAGKAAAGAGGAAMARAAAVAAARGAVAVAGRAAAAGGVTAATRTGLGL